MSKIARRTLWSSRSRSNDAVGDRPAGSIASTAARCARSASSSAEDGLAAAVAEQVVVLVQAERGAEHRVVADEPHEARLDEVVERVVERPGVGRRGRARQSRRRAWIDG